MESNPRQLVFIEEPENGLISSIFEITCDER